MRGIIVHYEVKIQFRRCFPVDLLQKLNPFLMSVSRHAGSNQPSLGKFYRGKQGGRAMALVVMRHGFTSSRLERQAGLCPIRCLNLSLPVNGQHQGMRWRILIQPHDIHEFLDEVRIITDFESPRYNAASVR